MISLSCTIGVVGGREKCFELQCLIPPECSSFIGVSIPCSPDVVDFIVLLQYVGLKEVELLRKTRPKKKKKKTSYLRQIFT